MKLSSTREINNYIERDKKRQRNVLPSEMFSVHHWATPNMHFPSELTFQEMTKTLFLQDQTLSPSTVIHIPTKKKSQAFQMTTSWTSAAILNRFPSSTAYSHAAVIWFKSNTCSEYIQSSLTSDSRILGRIEYKNIFCLGKLDTQTKPISIPIQIYYTQHSADKQLLSKTSNIWAFFAWLSYSD